jgi:hypothetical protein
LETSERRVRDECTDLAPTGTDHSTPDAALADHVKSTAFQMPVFEAEGAHQARTSADTIMRLKEHELWLWIAGVASVHACSFEVN